MAKTVRVHDDTHRALKRLKAQRRSRSVDEVVRELIKASTGVGVEEVQQSRKDGELTHFLGG